MEGKVEREESVLLDSTIKQQIVERIEEREIYPFLLDGKLYLVLPDQINTTKGAIPLTVLQAAHMIEEEERRKMYKNN